MGTLQIRILTVAFVTAAILVAAGIGSLGTRPAAAVDVAGPGLAGGVVVIDPGHGGAKAVGGSSANNAVGPRGTLEKDLTLEVGREVARVLGRNGYTVHLTRTTDENLGLADRPAIALAHRAGAFVSIHFNGDKDAKVQGTETLYHPKASAASIALAEAVQRRVRIATGLRNRGVKPQELGVLDPSRHDKLTAACLVEVSFLTDPAEESRLLQQVYKQRVAEAIATGISDYLNPR